MTIDTSALIPGLEGVPIAESSISQVDGVAGRLYYRGYSIEELTQGTSFEQVVGLLFDGEMPDAARLAELTQTIEAERALTPAQIHVAREVAVQTHPMFALQSVVAALGPKVNDFNQTDFKAAEQRMRARTRIISRAATLAA